MQDMVKKPRSFVVVAFLASIRPQLASAVLLATETFHRIGVDLLGSIPVRVVIKCQLGIGGDIANCKEGEVVQSLVCKTIDRNGDNLAIRVARVIDKSRSCAELLSVDNIAILIGMITIADQPVQAEEVRGLILIRGLASIGVFLRDDLAEVAIDELAHDDRLQASQAEATLAGIKDLQADLTTALDNMVPAIALRTQTPGAALGDHGLAIQKVLSKDDFAGF